MNILMQMMLYALMGVFTQNLIFTSGVGAERALRTPHSMKRVVISSLTVMFFSWISISGMYLIRMLSSRYPILENMRVLLLVTVMVIVYLILMCLSNWIHKPTFTILAEALPSSIFNSVVIMAGVVEQMLSLSYSQATGYAIGTGAGFFLATVLVREAIDDVENPAMPPAFVGLPSLLIYIGILAMAFVGFVGGPSVFL